MTNVGPLTLEQRKNILKEGFLKNYKEFVSKDIRDEKLRQLGFSMLNNYLDDQVAKNKELKSIVEKTHYRERIKAEFEKSISDESDEILAGLKIGDNFDAYFNKIIEEYFEEAILNIPSEKLAKFSEKLSRALRSSIPPQGSKIDDTILTAAVSTLRTDLFNVVSFFDKYSPAIAKVTKTSGGGAERNFAGYIATLIKSKDLTAPKGVRFEMGEAALFQGIPRYINPILLARNFDQEQAKKYFQAYANLVAGMMVQMGKNGPPFVKDKGIESIPIVAICEIASQLALNTDVQHLDEAQQRKYGAELSKAVGKDPNLKVYSKGFNVAADPKKEKLQQGAVIENVQKAIVASFTSVIEDKLLNKVELALADQMKKETITTSKVKKEAPKDYKPALAPKTKMLAAIYDELRGQRAKGEPVDIDKAVSEALKKIKDEKARETLPSISIPGVTLKVPPLSHEVQPVAPNAKNLSTLPKVITPQRAQDDTPARKAFFEELNRNLPEIDIEKRLKEKREGKKHPKT